MTEFTSVVPATVAGIRRVLNSEGGLVLVGLVVQEQPGFAYRDLVIDDSTGRVAVRHFDRIPPQDKKFFGQYVQVVGRLSTTSPQRLVSEIANHVTADAVAYHTIEVAHTALRKQVLHSHALH